MASARDALDFSTDDAWSLGEILDHLVKVDRVYLKNIDRLVARKKAGKMPFMYRGFADMVSLPKPLRKVAPLFELPMTLSNSLLPSAIRQSISANRSIPLKAPGILKPEKHRDGAALREDLRRLIDELDRLESKSFDLRKLYYYNPILGLVTVPGAVEFLAGHEKRHPRPDPRPALQSRAPESGGLSAAHRLPFATRIIDQNLFLNTKS